MAFGSRKVTSRVSELMSYVSIGEAATIVGISRATLRIWERERLVNPLRTRGGHRLFSPADIARLQEIARLRLVEGLNAAAVRRELGTRDQEAPSNDRTSHSELGDRLRMLRKENGWSLAEVGRRAQLSISFLSALERGVTNISVGNLFKLADAYGTTVPGLRADRSSISRSMLHPDDRPRFIAGSGSVLIEDLIASPGALEAQRIEVRPGGGSGNAYSHPGEEFIYVLSGSLFFQIEDTEHYRLTEGDSLFFRSERPHRWWNDGETSTTLLWINVPLVQPPGGSTVRATARMRDDGWSSPVRQARPSQSEAP
jgi:DNA-binding transcriptional MerR regulator/quercetin dioxygenase-like cupin family protein